MFVTFILRHFMSVCISPCTVHRVLFLTCDPKDMGRFVSDWISPHSVNFYMYKVSYEFDTQMVYVFDVRLDSVYGFLLDFFVVSPVGVGEVRLGLTRRERE